MNQKQKEAQYKKNSETWQSLAQHVERGEQATALLMEFSWKLRDALVAEGDFAAVTRLDNFTGYDNSE